MPASHTSAEQSGPGATPASSQDAEDAHLGVSHRNPQDPQAQGNAEGIDWVVTGVTAALLLAVVVWGLVAPANFADFASSALQVVVTNFGWLFVLAGSVFVGFILYVALSRFGSIRLGRDDEEPEFSTTSWIAMMFAAGMGIGLMFYGTTEPLTHFRNGVPGAPAGDSSEAFATTLFHWGLHPWALFAIVGLAIGYTTFRLGRRQLVSAAFIPLIGEKRAEGWMGRVIDILSIFATVFGTAASLGIGAHQISSGLDATGIVKNPGTWTIAGVVALLGVAFLASAASGVGKGIQLLSNVNMILAGILALFVLVAGPTIVILNTLPQAAGAYLSDFFALSSRTAESSDDAETWLSSWTIFYWAWWTSWSPFVGMFLARISRGRTIREFVMGVLLVPTAVTLLWFSIFGGTAIHLEKLGQSIWGEGDANRQLFDLLHTLPLGNVMAVIAMVLLATFFITSADSASTVMGSMSQHGRVVADRRVTVMWGLFTGVIALVLLLSGDNGSLSSLQSVTIIAASPFVLIIIGLMVSLQRALMRDPVSLVHKERHEETMREARKHPLRT